MTTPQDSRPGEPLPSYHQPPTATSATSSAAILAFVVGIFSVVAIWLLGPVAIILGNRAVREIDEGRAAPEGRGLAVAGRVLGIVGTVLLVLGIVATIAGLVFFVVVGSHLQTSP